MFKLNCRTAKLLLYVSSFGIDPLLVKSHRNHYINTRIKMVIHPEVNIVPLQRIRTKLYC